MFVKEREVLSAEKAPGSIALLLSPTKRLWGKEDQLNQNPPRNQKRAHFSLNYPDTRLEGSQSVLAVPLFSLGLVFFIFFWCGGHGILRSARVQFHLSCKDFKHDLLKIFPSSYDSYDLKCPSTVCFPESSSPICSFYCYSFKVTAFSPALFFLTILSNLG